MLTAVQTGLRQFLGVLICISLMISIFVVVCFIDLLFVWLDLKSVFSGHLPVSNCYFVFLSSLYILHKNLAEWPGSEGRGSAGKVTRLRR